MKSISLFEDKHSFLNGLSAKTKLAYIICAMSTPSLLGGYTSFVAFIILSLILLATSRILAKIKIVIQVTGFIIVTIFIVQTFFRSGNYTILFKLGPLIARKEGFEVAMKIVLNVLNISFAFCVLTLTTKPSDMMQEMTRAGLPPKMGYVFVSLFQIIPQITQQTSTIVDAQRSRGLKTKGSLITRFKAFLPLISPIIMSSFMSSKERTIALEVRGFSCNNQKTFIKPFKPSKYNTLFLCVCLIVIIASIIYALLNNLGYIAWQLFI